jgi:hypothetical protein
VFHCICLGQVYTLSKLHRLFRVINFMMEDSVRMVVSDCLASYCKYIEAACSQTYVTHRMS